MSQIIGVGLLLFIYEDGIPKIFTIRELKDKPQYFKKAGMLTFPLETFKPKDVNNTGTVFRLLEEEMGVSQEEVHILKLVEKPFHLIPGRKDISTFYGYGIFLGDAGRKFSPKDTDIEFAGWYEIKALLESFVRIEVCPIFTHLLSNGYYDELIGSLRQP